MGCIVNGPGEAREADVGMREAKKGIIFREGMKVCVVNEDEMVEALVREVSDFVEKKLL
jgi:4-hydroxy-3-methylbut-2-en-1-yl diphosphate synthase IspG/GcpE